MREVGQQGRNLLVVLGELLANWPVRLWKLLPEGPFDPTLPKGVLGARRACVGLR